MCKPPSSPQDVFQLYGLLRQAFVLMAMLDYPYSTRFIGIMPANPVKVQTRSRSLVEERAEGFTCLVLQVACQTMQGGSELLVNLRDAAGKGTRPQKPC